MKKVLFIGENGSGKEKLIQILSDAPVRLKKMMAVEYYGNFINTPSEFLEKKWCLNSLITASFDAEIILMVISAEQRSCLLPPLFAPLFNKKTIGVITYTEKNEQHFERAKRFLENAGVKNFQLINLETHDELEELKSELK